MERKCAKCKGTIKIDHGSIIDIIFYKKLYYHKTCFCELAEERSKSKRGKPEEWKNALNSVHSLEAETANMLRGLCAKDDLNIWLLDHYDISTVPSRFWQIVADLECGKYKGKRCKPVTIETLFGAWQWGQKKLDSIARNNKMKHTGPESDDARVMYDCSIIISKIPNYLSHKSKMKMLQETEKVETAKEYINYNNVQKTQVGNNDGLDDISGLLDDIF